MPVACLWRLGTKSWRPWLVALGLDVLSRVLLGETKNLSDQEREEVARRTAHWWWSILRAPCFDALLKYVAVHTLVSRQCAYIRLTPLCSSEQLQFLGGLGQMPLLGSLFRASFRSQSGPHLPHLGSLLDYIQRYRQYYFYTAASS